MRQILIMGALALVLGACEETLTADEQARMPNDQQIQIVASSQNQSVAQVRDYYIQCVKEGGRGIIGGFGQPACEKGTPDAGQSCTRESDCEGFCLAATNTCSAQNPLFGCHEILTDQGQMATICVD